MTDAKAVVKEFADKTTLHGVPRIIKSETIATKLLWLLVVIASLAVFGYYGHDIIKQYVLYEKKVDISARLEPITFPQLTLCNKYGISYTNMFTILDSLRPYWSKRGESYLPKDAFTNITQPEILEFLNYSMSSRFLPPYVQLSYRQELIYNIGVSTAMKLASNISEILMECKYMDEKCDVNITEIFDSYYYKCFAIDIWRNGELLKIQRGGPKQGVFLVFLFSCFLFLFAGPRPRLTDFIDVEYESQLEHFIKSFPGVMDGNNPSSLSSGFHLVINQHNHTAFPQQEGVNIATNTLTKVGISVSRTKRVGHPHGKCMDTTEPYLQNHKYSLTLCMSNCLQKVIQRDCNCTDISLPWQNDYTITDDACYNLNKLLVKYCVNINNNSLNQEWVEVTSKFMCTDERLQHIEKSVLQTLSCMSRFNDLGNDYFEAECDCYPPCDEVEITTKEEQITSEPQLSVALSEFITPRLNDSIFSTIFNARRPMGTSILTHPLEMLPLVMDSLSYVNLYLTDTKVTVLTESAGYSEAEMVADIGGMLGLCIGLSLVTVAEIIHMLVQCCLSRFKSKKVTTVMIKE